MSTTLTLFSLLKVTSAVATNFIIGTSCIVKISWYRSGIILLIILSFIEIRIRQSWMWGWCLSITRALTCKFSCSSFTLSRRGNNTYILNTLHTYSARIDLLKSIVVWCSWVTARCVQVKYICCCLIVKIFWFVGTCWYSRWHVYKIIQMLISGSTIASYSLLKFYLAFTLRKFPNRLLLLL